MKKVFLSVMAVSLVFAFTACSTSQTPESTSAAPPASSEAPQSEAPQSEAQSENTSFSLEEAQANMELLNAIYKETFGVEYNDANEAVKYGAYESEEAYMNEEDPVQLYSAEETPADYFLDPAQATYLPISNFSSMDELKTHLSRYFTDNYMQNIPIGYGLEDNFFEYNGELYLKRGGRGYGINSIALDTVSLHETEENALVADLFWADQHEGEVVAHFVMEDGHWKIDSVTEILG